MHGDVTLSRFFRFCLSVYQINYLVRSIFRIVPINKSQSTVDSACYSCKEKSKINLNSLIISFGNKLNSGWSNVQLNHLLQRTCGLLFLKFLDLSLMKL